MPAENNDEFSQKLDNLFSYHPPKNDVEQKLHTIVNEASVVFAKELAKVIKNPTELIATVRKIQEIRALANFAVSCERVGISYGELFSPCASNQKQPPNAISHSNSISNSLFEKNSSVEHCVENCYSAKREKLVELLNSAVKEIHIFHKKEMVISYKLPWNFTVTGRSNIANPENFDFNTGEALCYENAIKQLWELETYQIQREIFFKAEVE